MQPDETLSLSDGRFSLVARTNFAGEVDAPGDEQDEIQQLSSSPSGLLLEQVKQQAHSAQESCKLTPSSPLAPEEIDAVQKELLRRFGDDVQVHAIFIFGSTIHRLKGHVPKDVDILVVLTPRPGMQWPEKQIKQFHSGRCEVSVVEKEFFFKKQEEMYLQAWICRYTPPQFVLKPFDGDDARRFQNCKIDLPQLQKSILSYVVERWHKLRRVLDKWKNPYKAKKIVYYIFRALKLGCQLVESGEIQNLAVANEEYLQLTRIFEDLKIGPGDSEVLLLRIAYPLRQVLHDFDAKVQGQQPLTHTISKQSVYPEKKCAICLDDLEQVQSDNLGGKLLCGPNCGHVFHETCAAEAVRKAPPCPTSRGFRKAMCCLCRTSLRMEDSSDEVLKKWFDVSYKTKTPRESDEDEDSHEQYYSTIFEYELRLEGTQGHVQRAY